MTAVAPLVIVRLTILLTLTSLAVFVSGAAAQTPPTFVGSAVCADCHVAETEAWRGSHHQLAWTGPSPDTVLGDFDDARFDHGGVETRFLRSEKEYLVETDAADGEKRRFTVVGVVGVAPLQQYLLETEPGQLQAFDIVWDIQKRQWYHLYPAQELAPRDGLHWAGPYKNWSARCAECHATGFKKGYDTRLKIHKSTTAEKGVGCEACHGPGSDHVRWARRDKAGDDRYGLAVFDPADAEAEIQQCAQCHSRRQPLGSSSPPAGALYHDHYRPAVLREGLYHSDGQILDEVYVYGSFLQSKMYARGVRCTNCHDPHRADLKAETNVVCSQCHNPAGNLQFPSLRKARYDDPAHHFHAQADLSCADCHMPERVYMGIDGRRDHSFRIPRPDMSESIGTPNACTECHTDKPASWATTELGSRFGQRDPAVPVFPSVFHAARQGAGDASLLLEIAFAEDMPGIVRASALQILGAVETQSDVATGVVALLQDPDPLVRSQAVALQRLAPPQDRVIRILPRLEDETRLVRIETARALLDAPVARYPEPTAQALMRANREFQSSLLATADFPETQMALGGVALTVRNFAAAEAAFLEAVRLDPQLVMAWITAARIQLALGKVDLARETLSNGIAANPSNSDLLGAFEELAE